ncbi:hypothetical protein ACFE04_013506 [Oxalis oulophora]
MEVNVNRNNDHDFTEEMKKFVDTKAGVKGLVDSGLVKLPRIFIQPPERLSNSSTKSDVVTLTVPVINHRVPTDVIDGVLDGVKKFHEQPLEVKNEFIQSDIKQPVKFRTSAQDNHLVPVSWKDILACSYRDQQLDEKELPRVCRKTISEYTKHLFQLKESLSELLSEALGLCPDYLANIECMKSMSFVGNYYPPCPEPDFALGSNDHTDPYFLTILAQDNVGGLQVVFDNQMGALIINLGDLMQIISNDKFKSVVHRVLAGPTTRTSVACLFTPSSRKRDTEYGPLKEIISDDNPAVYQHVTSSEYVTHYLARTHHPTISKFKLGK